MDGIAELLNSNHRYKLLQEQVAEQEGQLREVCGRMKKFKEMDQASWKRKQQQETNEELKKQLKAILKKEGLFAVRLLTWVSELRHVEVNWFRLTWLLL